MSTIDLQNSAHTTHLEDLVLAGPSGIDYLLETMQSIQDTLGGHTAEADRALSTKIDGAPSAIIGKDLGPLKGYFVAVAKSFIGKKSWEKVKVIQTPKQADELYPEIPDLTDKLKDLLKYGSKLPIKSGEVWRGDFLYSKADVKTVVVDGREHFLFQPNTLAYAVPVDSEAGKSVAASKIGIIWHTFYKGTDLLDLVTSYDTGDKDFSAVKEIFATDPTIENVAGRATFTKEQTSYFKAIQAECEQLGSTLKADQDYEEFLSAKTFITGMFMPFQNTMVRQGKADVVPTEFVEEFKKWLTEKTQKKIDGLKTDSGRSKARAKLEEIFTTLDTKANMLKTFLDLINNIVDVKKMVISKLSEAGQLSTFYRKSDSKDNLVPTTHEGFVISDQSGNIVKLVDRAEFSYLNFSNDVWKPWKEATDREIRNTLTEPLDNILDPHNLERRKNLSKKSGTPGTFHTEIEAPEGIGRKAAAKKFADEEARIVLDKDIPVGNTRPVVTIDLKGFNVMLNFKDNKKTPTSLDAKQTAKMESVWAQFMQRENAGEDPMTYEEAAEQFELIDEHWYEGFKSGAELINQASLDSSTRYVFSREGETFPQQAVSIHKLINDAFTKRKDLFGKIGSKKDAWNPADIYACKQSDYSDVVNAWNDLTNQGTDIKDFNSFLLTNLESKTLVGISLKKPGDAQNPHVEPTNIDQSGDRKLTDYKLELIDCNVGLPPKYKGVKIILNHDILGAARYFGSSDKLGQFGGSLQAEFRQKRAKSQLGKVPQGIAQAWAVKYGIDIPGKSAIKRLLAEQEFSSLILHASTIEENLTAAGLSSVTVAEVSSLVDIIKSKYPEGLTSETFLSIVDDQEKREAIYISQLPIALAHISIYAEAYKDGQMAELLNDMIDGAKKIGHNNAPFVKLS